MRIRDNVLGSVVVKFEVTSPPISINPYILSTSPVFESFQFLDRRLNNRTQTNGWKEWVVISV